MTNSSHVFTSPQSKKEKKITKFSVFLLKENFVKTCDKVGHTLLIFYHLKSMIIPKITKGKGLFYPFKLTTIFHTYMA